MTNKDVFIQILSEVSGKTKNEVEALFDIIKPTLPRGNKFDQELTRDEAETLLSELRKEKSGILAWLAEGAVGFEKKLRHN